MVNRILKYMVYVYEPSPVNFDIYLSLLLLFGGGVGANFVLKFDTSRLYHSRVKN